MPQRFDTQLTHSPWIRNDLKSLSEYLQPPIEGLLQGAGSTFTSAGREDMDVRMLGDGRPFVIAVRAC